MKLEIEIPDEFFERLTAEINAKVSQKEIKQASVDYDTQLYAHASELFQLLATKATRSFPIVQAAVFDKIGSYKVEKYLSNDTYKTLINLLRSHCQRNDVWDFVKIDKKYSM